MKYSSFAVRWQYAELGLLSTETPYNAQHVRPTFIARNGLRRSCVRSKPVHPISSPFASTPSRKMLACRCEVHARLEYRDWRSLVHDWAFSVIVDDCHDVDYSVDPSASSLVGVIALLAPIV